MKIDRNPSAEEWDRYVKAHPQARVYHLHVWKGIIETSFGHPYHALCARDGGGRIRGILPLVFFRHFLFGRRLVSLPYVNYAGILADDLPAAHALAEAAIDLSRELRVRVCELRHLDMTLPEAWHVRTHKVTMWLDLAESPAAQWQGYRDKVRNQIRKAVRSGLTLQTEGESSLPEFYEIFARNMRDLGTPVYTRRFFEEILRRLPGHARLHLVRAGGMGGAAVAGAISLCYNETVEVPWAASLREARALCPNNLLYGGLIALSCHEGYRIFDFGRSTKGSGPWRFKKQWGTREIPCQWHTWVPEGEELPDLSPANPRFAPMISLWKRLPLAVTKVLGPPIVRHIP